MSPSNGGTYSIIVNSSSNWNTAIQSSSGTTWCTISPEKGDASTDKATIVISNNTEGEERQATITFVCGDAQQSINVRQEKNEVMSVSKNKYEVGSDGGTVDIKITSNVDFSYSIEPSAQGWISYFNTKSIKESTVSFSISKNNSLSAREGHITFNYGSFSETVTISQKGITPSITLSPSQSQLGKEGGKVTIQVTSNYDYEVTVPESIKSWVSLSSSNKATNTYVFTVAQNNGPADRSGEIVFSINDYIKSHQLSQKGDPVIEVTETSFSFPSEGGSGTINYSGNFKCESSVSASWISISSHSFNNSAGKIVFSVSNNENESTRDGKIVLSGYGKKVEITISQKEYINIVSITTTSPGTLSSFLGSSQRYQIKSYKISGPLNSNDIALIRDMAGDKGDKLKYLDLSDATIVAGGGSYWYEYYYYNGLKENKDHKYTSKDNTITSYMFTNCWRLKTLILPKSVTTIESNAFLNFSIASITLPDNLQTIESSFESFYLEEINLNNNNQYYTIVDGILYSKDMKILVSCPAKNPKIGNKYSIPSTVEIIFPQAFYYCTGIKDLVVPNTVKTIGTYAFAWCTFDSITIYPTTSYSYLGFYTKFKNVYIPSGYTEFDANIFVSGNFDVRGHCTIDHLWVYCTNPPTIDTWHQFNTDIRNNAVLHVPKGSLQTYQLAFCWGEFKTIQEFNP